MSPVAIYNFTYGLIFFSLAVSLCKFSRKNSILDFMAKISFPIYATHSILGYSLIRVLTDQGISASVSLLIVFFITILLALFIHITIEKPSATLGKLITKKPADTGKETSDAARA